MSAKELPDIYIAVGAEERAIFSVHYGRNGGAFVRRHYSGDIVGRASGGGWDVGSGALANALHRVFGIPEADGAIGKAHVIGEALKAGVRVYSLGDAMWALPAG